MDKFYNTANYRITFTIWTTLLTAAFLSPDTGNIPTVYYFNWPHFDKVVHVLAFTIFTLLFSLSIGRPGFWIVLIVASLYGITIEVLQIKIPGRSFETLDWLADIIGSFAGYLIFLYIIRRNV